jgi:hypothetical protein
MKRFYNKVCTWVYRHTPETVRRFYYVRMRGFRTNTDGLSLSAVYFEKFYGVRLEGEFVRLVGCTVVNSVLFAEKHLYLAGSSLRDVEIETTLVCSHGDFADVRFKEGLDPAIRVEGSAV